MKVLKSGVEMTPKELETLKGGSCSCGCNYSGYELNASADVHGNCFCNCSPRDYDPDHPLMLHGEGGYTAREYN